MTEELNIVYGSCEESMQNALEHLADELTKIRAGKANPAMVSGLMVDYYGTETPLSQVANISTPDARSIFIQPWEKGMLDPIEKSIFNANIGLTPQNNGEMVMLNIPALTEERRKDLAKQVHAEAETCRIGLRQSRKTANDEIKQMEKDGLSEDNAKDAEAKVQDITNSFAKKVEDLIKAKETELMTV